MLPPVLQGEGPRECGVLPSFTQQWPAQSVLSLLARLPPMRKLPSRAGTEEGLFLCSPTPSIPEAGSYSWLLLPSFSKVLFCSGPQWSELSWKHPPCLVVNVLLVCDGSTLQRAETAPLFLACISCWPLQRTGELLNGQVLTTVEEKGGKAKKKIDPCDCRGQNGIIS